MVAVIKLSKENGFNLLELMLALIIITSMILLAGYYYQIAKENTRVSQAVQLLNQLADASFKHLETRPVQLQQDMLPTLVNMDLLPESFKNNLQLSPWSTPVSIVYHKLPNKSFLEITIQKVPSKSCYQLMQLIDKFSGASSTCITSNLLKDFKGKFELKGIL